MSSHVSDCVAGFDVHGTGGTVDDALKAIAMVCQNTADEQERSVSVLRNAAERFRRMAQVDLLPPPPAGIEPGLPRGYEIHFGAPRPGTNASSPPVVEVVLSLLGQLTATERNAVRAMLDRLTQAELSRNEEPEPWSRP
jgi:hypothetical protein